MHVKHAFKFILYTFSLPGNMKKSFHHIVSTLEVVGCAGSVFTHCIPLSEWRVGSWKKSCLGSISVNGKCSIFCFGVVSVQLYGVPLTLLQ